MSLACQCNCSWLPASRFFSGRTPGVHHRLGRVQSMKIVHLLRHGQTEMNVYLQEHEDESDFSDPLL